MLLSWLEAAGHQMPQLATPVTGPYHPRSHRRWPEPLATPLVCASLGLQFSAQYGSPLGRRHSCWLCPLSLYRLLGLSAGFEQLPLVVRIKGKLVVHVHLHHRPATAQPRSDQSVILSIWLDSINQSNRSIRSVCAFGALVWPSCLHPGVEWYDGLWPSTPR